MRCHDVTWRTEGSSRSVPSRGTCGSPAGVGPCCGAPPKALLSAPRGWGEVAAARGRCHSPHVAGRISASAIKHHVGRAWVSSNCFYLHNEAQHGILLVSERGKSKPVPDKQPAPSPTRSSSHPFPRTDGCGVSPAPGSLLPPGSTVPPPALSVGAVTAAPPLHRPSVPAAPLPAEPRAGNGSQFGFVTTDGQRRSRSNGGTQRSHQVLEAVVYHRTKGGAATRVRGAPEGQRRAGSMALPQ